MIQLEIDLVKGNFVVRLGEPTLQESNSAEYSLGDVYKPSGSASFECSVVVLSANWECRLCRQ